MGRKPRIEVPGGHFHVTTRGVNREEIFFDSRSRNWFLKLLSRSIRRFDWICLAYCLMGNHYHLVIRTPEPTLARGMELLNGEYARYVNERFERDGHLFARRYFSVLIESDAQLLETCRYVVLNPVRAGLCEAPEEWRWSSYAGTAGLRRPADFLDLDAQLGLFGVRAARQERYVRFVRDGLARRVSI
jgi:REP element-mobilizing transposase RayT